MVYNLATVVYSDIPWQTVVYQLYTTARGFDAAHAKCYINKLLYTVWEIHLSLDRPALLGNQALSFDRVNLRVY